MTATATATEAAQDTAREAIKDAKKAARDSSKAASEASDDIQEDLESLREDITRLAQQLGLIVSARGSHAWNRARANVGDVLTDAEKKARKAGDELTDTISESIQERPYTTLAIAAGIGFLACALWRR
jgi:ElaB/YqjD/DUF883 family membrane-anchored ribosome-binding protein